MFSPFKVSQIYSTHLYSRILCRNSDSLAWIFWEVLLWQILRKGHIDQKVTLTGLRENLWQFWRNFQPFTSFLSQFFHILRKDLKLDYLSSSFSSHCQFRTFSTISWCSGSWRCSNNNLVRVLADQSPSWKNPFPCKFSIFCSVAMVNLYSSAKLVRDSKNVRPA